MLKRPFAHTAGKTLFRWFERFAEWTKLPFGEDLFCRRLPLFPRKKFRGTDASLRPMRLATARCGWMMRLDFAAASHYSVGRLAIVQFIDCARLDGVIGRKFRVVHAGYRFDLIPLPHPSGASPWHKVPPGKALTERALKLISRHPAIERLARTDIRSSAKLEPLRPCELCARMWHEIPIRADVPRLTMGPDISVR